MDDTPADVTSADVRAAYDATGAAWDSGPRRIYDLLAVALLDRCPVPTNAALALDAGAGTGAATAELIRRGAAVTAVDLSAGMLRCLVTSARPPACVAVGDVTALPVRSDTFDMCVAAFVLNHLAHPVDGLGELGRAARPGGAVLASVFAETAPHPSKEAIDSVATHYGFSLPNWHRQLTEQFVPQVGTASALAALAHEAALVDVCVELVLIEPELTDAGVAAWRTGMAHLAPFIASLPPTEAQALRDDARAAVAGMPAVTLSMLVLSGRAV